MTDILYENVTNWVYNSDLLMSTILSTIQACKNKDYITVDSLQQNSYVKTIQIAWNWNSVNVGSEVDL